MLAPVSLTLLLVACGGMAATASPGSRDLILRAEIDENPATNAWDLVQSLRPQWLRVRDEIGIGRRNDLVVYMDNARIGGRDSLRQIAVGNVQYLRYYNSVAANQRWGAGHAYGVIQISTHAAIR